MENQQAMSDKYVTWNIFDIVTLNCDQFWDISLELGGRKTKSGSVFQSVW